jgi:hypothetical protein
VPWRLVSSGQVRSEFKQLCAVAASQGRLDAVLATMKALHQQLTDDPLSVGEPKFRLNSYDLMVHLVLRRPLSVHFAIDEQRKLVYWQRIELHP